VTAFVNEIADERKRIDAKVLIKLMQWTGEKPKKWGSSIIGFGKKLADVDWKVLEMLIVKAVAANRAKYQVRS
jgi:hypothetical protein